MDGRSSQQGLDRIMTSKKDNNVASKSSVSERDRNSQYCNRIGCSGRIKYSQSKRIGNEVTGNTSSSSSSGSVITSSKKPYVDGKRNFTSQPKHNSSESSLSVYSAASKLVSAPNSSSSGYHSKLKKTSDKTIMGEAGSSSGSLNIKPLKDFDHKLKLPNCNASASSSFSNKGNTVRPVNGSSGNKYGLRSMPCNSTSDVVPPSSSSLDTKSAAKNVMRKRSQEGEKNSSSHRGERKKNLVSTSVVKGNARSFDSGILISDSRQSSSASGEDNNRHANSRTGRIGRKNNVLDNEIPFRVGGRSSSRPFSSNLSSTGSRSRCLLSADSDRPLQRTPFASSFEPGYSHLVSRDLLCHYNMNDIDAVLFALELLEQDMELTHEQVRLLESSSLLNGLNLYDQHRDMRLDIDNMSYEELLALGERMGTVSTALSEEEMSKCLEKGIYQQTALDVQVTGDDSKCSICQEEYEVGDETGTLVECKHEYHASCITQWFRGKNWCPICKASAVGTSRSSSSS